MFALVLTLCFSSGECYAHVPELFSEHSECAAELLHLSETLQIDAKNMECKAEKEV